MLFIIYVLRLGFVWLVFFVGFMIWRKLSPETSIKSWTIGKVLAVSSAFSIVAIVLFIVPPFLYRLLFVGMH